MVDMRKGENERTVFRSSRVFSVNGEWFFATREGVDHGPFPDREEAEAALAEFIRDKSTEDQRIKSDDD